MTINWNADATDNVAVTGYIVYRNNVQAGTTNGASTVTYQDNGLSANTTYSYEVSARDAAGNLSPRTPVFSVTTPTPPVDTTPPVISNVVSSNLTSASATITWTTDEQADSQVAYGTTVAYGSLTTLNTAMVTSHSAVVSGLTPKTTYHYQVLSRDSSGNAAASADYTFTTTAASPLAFVQAAASANSSPATTISQTFTSSVTTGNAIVAAVSWDSAGGSILNMTCSDNRGDVFATATNVNDSTNSQALAICYATNVAGGATTVTATFNGSATFRNISVSEYSGIATTNSVDVVKTNIANGTTAVDNITSTAATTTTSGDLIFGVVMDDTASNTNITAGTGFARRSYVGASLATEDKVQSSAGSTAATFTFGTAHRYLAQFVAFRAN